MTSETKDRKWSVGCHPQKPGETVLICHGKIVGEVKLQKHAALICAAVNSHEALVEALEGLLLSYENHMHSEFDFPVNHGGPWTPERDKDVECIAAHDALAPAKGTT